MIVTHAMVGTLTRHNLCAANADGLSIYMTVAANHAAITVTNLFGHHVRLLGRHRANWTPNPIA